jgi:hypothetical protein
MMVQSAKNRQRKNAAGGMDGSGYGRVLRQRQVRSGAVVVMRVRAQHMTQMGLVVQSRHLMEWVEFESVWL